MDLSKTDSPERSIFTEKVNNIRNAIIAEGGKEMVMHFGSMDQEEVNTISTIVENQLENNGVSKNVVKKIFNIAIEALQNICLHGEKDVNGNNITYFIIEKQGNEFTLFTGNVVSHTSEEKLTERLNRLKALSDVELKKEYLDVLSNGELSKKGGAGLGFLTIALKSNNNTEYNFVPINKNYSLFSQKAKVVTA